MIDFFQGFIDHFATEFKTPFESSVMVFSIILFIILLSPIVLKKAKLPPIIGLIISGIIIGPHGLNLIEKNSAVDLFSTIGLLYIMFIAGLELDLREFSKNRHKSLVFGLLTFFLPIAIGLPACLYILGYGMDASVLTASMFATHTLLTYPIVSRMGISKNEAVAITVGGTILTDTAVLLILAVIAGSAQGDLTIHFWASLAMFTVLFVALSLFVIPRLSRWFFQKLESEKYAHFIYVLAVVFFFAFLAEIGGLEPIIGAFVAGLTLNRLIPQTSSLMNRIEFAGNALFIPFFLISVGMLVDIRLVTKGPETLFVAAVLTVVALVGKWAAALITGWILKYTRPQTNLVFGLSSAHAAATLAVILVGYKLQIIDENILNGTIILILLTSLVSSFVTENSAKKVALLEAGNDADAQPSHQQTILVPVTENDNVERLVDFAIYIKSKRSPSPILGLAVVDDDESASVKLLQARKRLEKAILHAAAFDQKVDITATIDHNLATGIKRASKELFATEIVLAWPERTFFADLIFGQTTDNIVLQTSQMVYLVNLPQPISSFKVMKVVCGPFAEKEPGFRRWMDRMVQLVTQLSLRIEFFCPPDTSDAIKHYLRQQKASIDPLYHPFTDWEDFLVLARHISISDLMVVVSSRKGSLSYFPAMENLPSKMKRYFDGYSLIFIYPMVIQDADYEEFSIELDASLLERSIQQIRRGRQGIQRLFERKPAEKK